MQNTQTSLIIDNLKLVHSICHKMNGEYDDMFQTGCVGLIKAAKAFNPDKGYTFSTYAFPIIRNEILMSFRKLKPIVYLGTPVKEDDEGNMLTLLDTFASNENVESDALESVEAQHKINLLKSKLSQKYLSVLDGLSMDLKQHEIAAVTGLSRPYVNKLIMDMKKIGKLIDKDYQTGSKSRIRRLGKS